MQRKRRKKKRFGVFLFLLVVCIGIGIMFVPWAMQPENFREVKNKINGFLYKEDFPDSYNAKSLILVDCSDDEIFVSKNENEPQIPASLAKLFVIEYSVLTKMEQQDIHKVINQLNSEERMIIYGIFFENKTQTQMAEIMGISRQMLSYKLKSILNKMREMYMNKFF